MAAHRSEGERAKWLSRWRASGQSCEQFARQHGLSPSTLYRWSQRGGRGKVTPSFAEVRVVGAIGSTSLEVTHPSGCVIRVSGSVDEAQLTAVLRALGAC
jgi:hypothetical protein